MFNPAPINLDRCSQATPTSVTAAVADTLVLAANPLRIGASIQNDSTAKLYLLLTTDGSAASLTNYTVLISANTYYETPFKYTGPIRGYWDAANGAARVTEFTP